jgi:hypothetical protein
MAVALLMFCSTTPSQAGLAITITGSGPSDTTPEITFSGSGAFGASTINFLQVTAFDLTGGQYVNDFSGTNQQVNLTGGALTIDVYTSGNVFKWSGTVDYLLLNNDGSETVPSGGELDIVLNETNAVLAGDLYVFSGSAQLELSDSPLVDTTFSVFNVGNYTTSSTGVLLSASSTSVFGGESIDLFIIPEPSSLALSLMGAGILFYWRRRRTGKG